MLANPAYQRVKRPRPIRGSLILVSAVVLLTLVVGLICAWMMLQTVASYYATRIYPQVYVMGMKVGRLTPEEATVLLNGLAGEADTGLLLLRDGETRWSIPWSEAGMHMDVTGTVRAAFAIGHTGDQGWRDQVRDWLGHHNVAPAFSVDSGQARQVLEHLAPGLALPPTDATLHLPQRAEDPVVALPGQPGRELDIDATLAQLLAVAGGQNADGGVDLVFRAVPPRIPDVRSFVPQVEEMLDRRIELSTYDVLIDETYAWTLGRGEAINWLHIVPTPNGPTVELDQEAIKETLVNLSAELGAGRGFKWAEATEQVADAFNAGGGAVTLYLTHPVRTYVVQSGDTLSSIASAFGMTAWHVIQANPDTDPDRLHIGQQLTIPSQDELTPLTPVPGKRIVVSIADQRMRAYANGELVYDWLISTGIATSPTHTGVFQILSKEENAYASLWDLWMPHFIAIYAAGPDFYNGFHGLPTLSNGRLLWEGLLGSPASYGCIILGLEEAEILYSWADLGVVVVVE